jgi:3-oxoacyl-[acyl-carrier-protein] synthase II
VLSTGCTSSTDALGHALSLIRYGRADVVLAGGADAPIAPGILAGFCLMRIMTASWNDEPERGSRPFARDRDGFVLAEGAWMFVLEALESARARGARIHGELAGYASTCEAFHRVRLDESGEESARAMQLALEDAGVAHETVDYLNLHGTSTVLNDRIETRAVKQVFGRRASSIPASSLKSILGHPQGACGAAGVAASLLAMRDGFVPPTINHDEADPECDLDVIPHRGRALPVATAVCNCIGFGSKNAAVVLRSVDSRDGR